MSRITRNTQTPPPVRSTPPAKSHANGTTTPATNTPANQTTATNRAHELTQAARFVRASLERILTTAANARNNQQRVQDAANQVRQSYGNPQGQTYPMNAARELARQLSQTGDPQFRQQLIAELAKDPQLFADILRAAGGDPFQNTGNQRDRTEPINDGERRVIAQSLGSAYDAGLITNDDVRKLVAAEAPLNMRMGSANGDFVGILVAQSSSNGLMRDYATAVLEFVRDAPTPHHERMVNSAARAMAGSPEVLTEMIGRLQNNEFAGQGVNAPITLSGFIERLSDYQVPGFEMPVSGTRTTALGDILTTAAQANLDTKLALFEQTIHHGRLDQLSTYNAGGTVLEALTNLYRSDARAITDRLNTPENLRLHGLVTMSRFFQYTMFNSLVSDSTKEGLVQTLDNLADQYRNENRPNALGRLSGTIINGFALSVREQRNREQATRDLINLVFDIVPVPDRLKEIFGTALGDAVGEHLGNLIAERGIEGAQEAFTRYLSEQLTQGSNGFLGLGAWSDIRNANDLDALLKALFDVGSLPDPNPLTQHENEAVTTDYEQGIDTAERALRNEGITVRP